jgi:hypothetical protein
VRTLARDVTSARFLGHLAKETFASIGLLSASAGLTDALFPDVFEGHGTSVGLAILAVSIAWGGWRAWPRPIRHSYVAPKTTISVLKGDLFAEESHLVIGTCDTFDTKVPNVISPKSVQGQALQRLYGGDVERLDVDLQAALRNQTPIGSMTKEGKTDRYEMGTVAVIPNGPRHLFFLAYTEMNEKNEARGTADGVWKSLLALWSAVSAYSNGDAISIPVIGGGQARISQILPAQDSIRFIAFSYMLAARHESICNELRIVVDAKTYERLDRLELQAFLDSLEMS